MLVLVADDDSETVVLVSAILQKAGYQTTFARDALQVLALSAQRHPDLVVLDLQMPAGTGIAALERLKNSYKTAQIPVIVLSGTADPAKIDRVRQLGAVEFLHKPVDPEALLAAVKRALESGASPPS